MFPMKMKRYGDMVRKTALQTRKNQMTLQIQRSPQGPQQGWNTNPCEKLLIAPNKKSCMRDIKLLLPEYQQICTNFGQRKKSEKTKAATDKP